MTFDQQEPSANSPWTKTTFFVFGDVWALAIRSRRGRAALAAAAPMNVRRFIIVSPTGDLAASHRWHLPHARQEQRLTNLRQNNQHGRHRHRAADACRNLGEWHELHAIARGEDRDIAGVVSEDEQ